MRWIQTGGSGAAGSPGPPGPPATPPPGLTTVSAPSITVDVQGNVVLVFDMTFPAILGTMTQIFIRVEMPYAGGLSSGTDINLPPAAVIDDSGPYPLDIVSGVVQNTQAYITEPAPAQEQIWAAWFATGSGDYRNDWADPSTILVTFTVDPTVGLTPGEEWAPNPTDLSVTVAREVRKGSEQWWRPSVSWTLPDSTDPRFPQITQWNIGLLNPEIAASDPERQIVTLSSVPPSTTSWSGSFARVSDHDIRYIIMVRPQNAQGDQNSYVPGITAALPITIGPQTIIPGKEQADVVTGLTASGAWGKDDQGNRQFQINVAWTNPTDPRFGGVVLSLVSQGAYALPPGHGTTGIEVGPTKLITLASKDGPGVNATWYILAFSVDANGIQNTYVSGVTPSAPFSVESWFTGAPTLQASGLVVTAGGGSGSFYSDVDYNGIPELALTVTFTPPDPAIDPSWAYVDFWAQRPDDGLWYNYISINKSGTTFRIGQLPKTTGTWHFLLIDYDVNGKNLLGDSTGDPTAPPSGSATFSLSIPPPSIGASGIEYASLVTSPAVTIGSPVTQPDGTYKELVSLSATLPSDSRFGGFKVIVKYTSGALNNKFEEIADLASPQTSADIIWTPPAGSISSSWYFVSYNKLGQLNTIVGGTTPAVSKTVGTTSKLDFSAAKLASLNQNLLRLNPATGQFEPYNIEQAIYAVLQLGGGTLNGTCNVSGTAVVGVAGSSFTSGMAGKPFFISGVGYTVAVFTDATHLTLAGGGAGIQTGAAWSFGRSPQFKIFDRTNTQIGFWGDDSFNTNFVGMFAGREVRLGGLIADGGLIEVDSAGSTVGIGGTSSARIITVTSSGVDIDGATLRLAKNGILTTLESQVIGSVDAGLAVSIDDTNKTLPVILSPGYIVMYDSIAGLDPRFEVITSDPDVQLILRYPTDAGAGAGNLGVFLSPIQGLYLYETDGTTEIYALPSDGTLRLSQTITRYKNVSTVGIGVPAIYAAPSHANQGSSIGATNLRVGGSIAPAGKYRVSVVLSVHTAGSGSTVFQVHWTDRTGVAKTASASTLIHTANAGTTATFDLYTAGGADITYSTNWTSSGTTDIDITLERLT